MLHQLKDTLTVRSEAPELKDLAIAQVSAARSGAAKRATREARQYL